MCADKTKTNNAVKEFDKAGSRGEWRNDKELVVFYTALGKKIRQERTILGWTQEDLGDKLDITHQQVQKMEIGEVRMTFDRVVSLAVLFNKPLENLIPSSHAQKLISQDPSVERLAAVWDLLPKQTQQFLATTITQNLSDAGFKELKSTKPLDLK